MPKYFEQLNFADNLSDDCTSISNVIIINLFYAIIFFYFHIVNNT